MPLALRPPLRPRDFLKGLSPFPLPLLFLLLGGSFPPGKVRCMFLLPKRMKLSNARTHRERRGRAGERGGVRAGRPSGGAKPERGREGIKEGAAARAAAQWAAGERPLPTASWGAEDRRAPSAIPPRAPPLWSPPRRVTRRTRGQISTCESPLRQGALAAGPGTEERGAKEKGPGDLGRQAGGGCAGGHLPRICVKSADGGGGSLSVPSLSIPWTVRPLPQARRLAQTEQGGRGL